MSGEPQLSELERDALGEAFNLALGEAASSFADLVQEEIHISVPSVDLLTRAELQRRLSDQQLPGLGDQLCAINQSFSAGDTSLRTQTLLLFAESGGLEIVRRMLGQADTPLDQITELEQDALGEIGNIIINSCMGTLAEIFGTELLGSLPLVQRTPASQLFSSQGQDEWVLVVRIGLTMSSHSTTGYVLFLMDLPSFAVVMERVRSYFGMG